MSAQCAHRAGIVQIELSAVALDVIAQIAADAVNIVSHIVSAER